MFLTEDEILMGYKNTNQNITVRSLFFNFADLCSGIGTVWSAMHNANRTRVSQAIAVTFSVNYFKPLKLYPLSGNIFRKWFVSYFLFIHEHLIIT